MCQATTTSVRIINSFAWARAKSKMDYSLFFLHVRAVILKTATKVSWTRATHTHERNSREAQCEVWVPVLFLRCEEARIESRRFPIILCATQSNPSSSRIVRIEINFHSARERKIFSVSSGSAELLWRRRWWRRRRRKKVASSELYRFLVLVAGQHEHKANTIKRAIPKHTDWQKSQYLVGLASEHEMCVIQCFAESVFHIFAISQSINFRMTNWTLARALTDSIFIQRASATFIHERPPYLAIHASPYECIHVTFEITLNLHYIRRKNQIFSCPWCGMDTHLDGKDSFGEHKLCL